MLTPAVKILICNFNGLPNNVTTITTTNPFTAQPPTRFEKKVENIVQITN